MPICETWSPSLFAPLLRHCPRQLPLQMWLSAGRKWCGRCGLSEGRPAPRRPCACHQRPLARISTAASLNCSQPPIGWRAQVLDPTILAALLLLLLLRGGRLKPLKLRGLSAARRRLYCCCRCPDVLCWWPFSKAVAPLTLLQLARLTKMLLAPLPAQSPRGQGNLQRAFFVRAPAGCRRRPQRRMRTHHQPCSNRTWPLAPSKTTLSCRLSSPTTAALRAAGGARGSAVPLTAVQLKPLPRKRPWLPVAEVAAPWH